MSSHTHSRTRIDLRMANRHYILMAWLLSLACVQPALAVEETDAGCGEARVHLSQQIQEARLSGNISQRAMLETRLQNLTKRCRGVVPLQSNKQKVEHASRVATAREAQLREALSTGDAQTIDLSKRRLDQARKALEAAKR